MGYFLSVLLLFSAFMCTVDASPDTTASFRGGGVMIDLTYPEEAHPSDTITHNIKINTTNGSVSVDNFTLVIEAPVNSIWQEIYSSPFSFFLSENESILITPSPRFTLPQNANGTLKCTLYAQTNQTADYLSCTFYTTHVSEPTISELQSMWEDYTVLKANYIALNETYYNLLEDYHNLLEQNATLSEDLYNSVAAYNALLNNYNRRLEEYNALNSRYETLDSNYRSKLNELSALQLNYDDLNSTRNDLQGNYTSLQALYDELDQKYNNLLDARADLQKSNSDSQSALNNDRIVMFIFVITLVALIAFIIYLKRGKEEPYVVIRKETVSMNQDENS